MKFIPLLLPLILSAGCRTAATQLLPTPAIASAPTVAMPTPAPAPVVTAPVQTALDQRLKQQRQMIEALMSQNDALTAKLNAPAPTPPPVPAPILAVAKIPPTPQPEILRPLPTLPPATVAPDQAPKPVTFVAPNADGVIDLTVVASAATDPVNPFAVRHLPPESAREITLRISGIIGGTAPAVLVNGRAVRSGESVESLTLERCEPDAAIFRRGEHWLRLPISAQPVRIRIAL